MVEDITEPHLRTCRP